MALPAILAGIGTLAPELLKRFVGDKDAKEQNVHTEQVALLNAFAAEMLRKPEGWWTKLWSGISSSVRPIITYAVFALPAWAVFDPVRAAIAFNSLDIIPEPVWWLIGTITAFWFGSRPFEKRAKEVSTEKRLEIARGIQQTLDKVSAPTLERTFVKTADDLDARLDKVDEILEEVARRNREHPMPPVPPEITNPDRDEVSPSYPPTGQNDQLPLSLVRAVSARGLNFIQDQEGLRLKPYQCTAGVWTIGYGHTGPNVTKNTPQITREIANEIFEADIRKFAMAVETAVTVPMQQHQFDMLVSLTFNIGIKALQGSQAVTQTLNNGDYEKAADGFLLWCKETVNGKKVRNEGLYNRRTRERNIFLKGYIM